MQELLELVRGDVDQDMPARAPVSQNQSGRGLWPIRCGPSPTVFTTRPIAPSATSRDAATVAFCRKCSE